MYRKIPTSDELQAEFFQNLPLSQEDYILGVADLTYLSPRFLKNWVLTGDRGELMRRAISNISTRPGHAIAMEICTSLRQIQASFQQIYIPSSMFGFPKDLSSKIEVMKASVAKVENACYNVVVRGSERPDGWDMGGKEDGNKRERDGDDDAAGDGKRQKFDRD